jgi:hypothetical protein
MKKLSIIFIFILFTSTLSFACENINLFETNPRMLETKIVNQGDMSTCYAHSLAALYSMEKATRIEDSLHTYWVAFTHKQRFIHWKPRNLDYSLLSWAYSDVKKHGICPYNLVQDRIDEVKNGINYSNDQLMFLLHTFFVKKKFHNISKNSTFTKVLKSTLVELQTQSSKFEQKWTLSDLSKILTPIKDKAHHQSFFHYLKHDVFEQCSKASFSTDEHLLSLGRGFEPNKTVQSRIEMALGEDKAIAIGYCSRRVLKADPNSTKNAHSFPRITRAFSSKCGAHYSLLAGSRKVGKRCELLLRNSYGEGFWGQKGMKYWCLDESTGLQRNCSDDENNPHLKVLGAWIDASKMAANTYEMSYFD